MPQEADVQTVELEDLLKRFGAITVPQQQENSLDTLMNQFSTPAEEAQPQPEATQQPQRKASRICLRSLGLKLCRA